MSRIASWLEDDGMDNMVCSGPGNGSGTSDGTGNGTGNGMLWYAMVCCGMALHGVVWHCMAWGWDGMAWRTRLDGLDGSDVRPISLLTLSLLALLDSNFPGNSPCT